jgi:two-component system sensor histidine kinase BarA
MKKPIIDLSLGAARIQKDLTAAKSMLQLLSQHLPTDYLKIDSALQKKEWQALREANHALLGALLYCGAPRLESACIALQTALQINNDAQIAQSAKNLLFEMKNLIAHTC